MFDDEELEEVSSDAEDAEEGSFLPIENILFNLWLGETCIGNVYVNDISASMLVAKKETGEVVITTEPYTLIEVQKATLSDLVLKLD